MWQRPRLIHSMLVCRLPKWGWGGGLLRCHSAPQNVRAQASNGRWVGRRWPQGGPAMCPPRHPCVYPQCGRYSRRLRAPHFGLDKAPPNRQPRTSLPRACEAECRIRRRFAAALMLRERRLHQDGCDAGHLLRGAAALRRCHAIPHAIPHANVLARCAGTSPGTSQRQSTAHAAGATEFRGQVQKTGRAYVSRQEVV